jgi:hypothetical protein
MAGMGYLMIAFAGMAPMLVALVVIAVVRHKRAAKLQ